MITKRHPLLSPTTVPVIRCRSPSEGVQSYGVSQVKMKPEVVGLAN